MRGYKVFNPDFTCLGYQFAEGETYIHDRPVKLCSRGFHFCLNAGDCFSYYDFDPQNIVCEVEAELVSEETQEDSKRVCGKIKVVRRLSWEEVLRVANSGFGNSGNRNSGNRNSGNHNSGHGNSGHGNSGDYNSGDYNSGDYNSGDYNSGHGNSGDYNSGDYNSGDYNSGHGNRRFFCSGKSSDVWFNKETTETAVIPYVDLPVCCEWIYESNMTVEEKQQNPQHTTLGGCLRSKPMKVQEAFPIAWAKLPQKVKDQFLALPNFDAEVFFQCTGVRV